MRRILVLAGAMLIFSAAPAMAGQYGAIAYDRSTRGWGLAHDFGSQESADKAAMTNCRKGGAHCEIVGRFSGEVCAAYATGPGGAVGWGEGGSRLEATVMAEGFCGNKEGMVTGCEMRVWACNFRVFRAPSLPYSPSPKCTWWEPGKDYSVTGDCSSSRRPVQ